MVRSKGPGKHARVREAPAHEYGAKEAPRALTGVILDTDILIEALRRREPVVGQLRALMVAGTHLYTTPVTLAEIVAGMRPGEAAATENYLARLGEVRLDAAIGRRAGAYLAHYARSHRLELPDALIAAAAVLSGLPLWTRNRRDYPMPDITLYQPG